MSVGSSMMLEVSKVRGHETVGEPDHVAVEEPLEIRLAYSGPDSREVRSISITMRTPGNDAELAAGFLYTEGIVESTDQIAEIHHLGPQVETTELRNVIRVDLVPEVRVDLERLKRHFYTTSSCGVCGKTSLEALRVNGKEPLRDNGFIVSRDVLCALPEKLRSNQEVFDETGGLHASALFDAEGQLDTVREDVGRHNAVDKLVGACLLEGRVPVATRGILVSGRASFELMQKAMMAGIPMLAAVGAPSSLAVELATEFRMTLIGFLRDGRFNIYSGEERVS